MKAAKEVLTAIGELIVWAAHKAGLLYVAKWDAPEWGFGKPKKEAPLPIQTHAPDGVKTMQYGEDTPDKAAKMVQYREQQTSTTEWEFARFDGKWGSRNFIAWHSTDDFVIARRRYTPAKVEQYKRVRPMVIEGLTNPLIATALGMSERTADEYAGAVREAFRLRANPSPTGQRGEGTEEAPQLTANND